jgi:hypothetical protein
MSDVYSPYPGAFSVSHVVDSCLFPSDNVCQECLNFVAVAISRLSLVAFVLFCEVFGNPCYTNFIKAKYVWNDFMESAVTYVQTMGHFGSSHLSVVQCHEMDSCCVFISRGYGWSSG